MRVLSLIWGLINVLGIVVSVFLLCVDAPGFSNPTIFWIMAIIIHSISLICTLFAHDN